MILVITGRLLHKSNVMTIVITVMEIVSLLVNLLCGTIVSISEMVINVRTRVMRRTAEMSSVVVVTVNNAVRKGTKLVLLAW